MKKLLIFIFILIAVVSCNNASKTGTSYNNSSNNNTEQGSNEEGNNSGTEQGGTSSTDNNKEWLDKTANQKISKMNYYFDSNGDIINNGDRNKIYTFYKSLGNDTAIYYYEGDPTYLYDIGDTDSPSGITVKVYCLVKIPADGNNIYFLDGRQPQNCTTKYRVELNTFRNENNTDPNWNNFPYMTENDIDIKDNRWTDWGYFGANIVR